MHQVAEALEITIPADFNFSKALSDPSSLTMKLQLLFTSLNSNSDVFHQQELFFDCMSELLRQPKDGAIHINDRKDQRIQILIDFISSHFKEEVSLSQMAELIRLNPFHLVRLFKKTIGVSPYDYLIILRTEYAKQLLRKGYKVLEAAIRAGFYDTSHLNRSLRKIAGTSPRSFLLSKGQYHTSFIA